VAERIRAALSHPGLPEVTLHGSADAVAAQALRRLGGAAAPAADAEPGDLTVLLAGNRATLTDPALTYAEGRLLAAVTHAH
ncbi:glutamate racemase, partial [Streptomyces niveus]